MNLKPCPFCGSERISYVFDEDLFGYAMSCESCFARGPVYGEHHDCEQEWNIRSAEPEQKENEIKQPFCRHCGVVCDLHNEMYCRLVQEARSKQFDEQAAEIKKLRSKYEWISVEERLPHTTDFVIATNYIEGWSNITHYRPSDKTWFGFKPTHWMPLPELPKP